MDNIAIFVVIYIISCYWQLWLKTDELILISMKISSKVLLTLFIKSFNGVKN